MSDLFNEYGRKARLFPALLCLPPFLLIKHFAIDSLLDPSLAGKLFVIALGDVSLAAVLIYLLSQVNRFISKTFFEDKARFPTTQMLLPSSKELSSDFRSKIESKVTTDFRLSLPNSADEMADLENARLRINEIVALIINKVGSGKLLLQHNTEYGFMRNLIGGSVISLIASVAGIVLFGLVFMNNTAYVISMALSVCYLLPLLFSRPILTRYGKDYARILFREYLGSN